MEGTELPGYQKKSFAMFFGNSEIWFEQLDGLYEFTDLAIQKLKSDYEEIKRPSKPSLLAVNMYETAIDEQLCNVMIELFTSSKKRLTKIVFIGVDRVHRKYIQKRLSNRGIILEFINDFEKAKEWLVNK